MPHALVQHHAGERGLRCLAGAQADIAGDEDGLPGARIVEALGVAQRLLLRVGERVRPGVVGVEQFLRAVEDLGLVPSGPAAAFVLPQAFGVSDGAGQPLTSGGGSMLSL